MKNNVRIILAEDENVTRRKLEFLLKAEGHAVISVPDGTQALEKFKEINGPILGVIDILMPGRNGIELCQDVQKLNHPLPPYMILLTVKDSKEDVVRGLEAGANDYITKPFDREELRARVRTGIQMLTLQQKLADRVQELEDMLSRVRHLQGLLRNDMHDYEFGDFRLEVAERRLMRGNQTLPLTAKVFDLLLLLVQNSGHLVEKNEIMREIWGDAEVEDSNLTVSMSMLRKTIGEKGDEYIETVPKRGYRFTAEVRRIS